MAEPLPGSRLQRVDYGGGTGDPDPDHYAREAESAGHLLSDTRKIQSDQVQGQFNDLGSQAQATGNANLDRLNSIGQYNYQQGQTGQANAASDYAAQGKSRAGQMQAVQDLRNWQAQGPGPSVASAQYQQAADTSMAQQLAMARSGRGAGGNAAAMRQAQFANVAQGQQLATQASTARMQEQQQWRQNQLAAMGQEQQGLQGVRAQDLGSMGQNQQVGLGYTGQGNQAEQAGYQNQLGNNQLAQGYYGTGANMGYNYTNLGQQAQQHGADTMYNIRAGAQNIGAGQENARFTGQNASNTAFAQMGQQSDQAALGAVGTVAGAGLMAASMASDERVKTDAHRQGMLDAIKAMGGGRSELAASDENCKTDLRPAQGYSYRYKDPDMPGAAPGRHYGPMAQDLEKTAAGRSTVIDTPTGKQVDTGRLALVSASAIAEQQKRMDKTDAKLDRLLALAGGR